MLDKNAATDQETYVGIDNVCAIPWPYEGQGNTFSDPHINNMEMNRTLPVDTYLSNIM